MRKEFVPGKLKPEYALMNKIIGTFYSPQLKTGISHSRL